MIKSYKVHKNNITFALCDMNSSSEFHNPIVRNVDKLDNNHYLVFVESNTSYPYRENKWEELEHDKPKLIDGIDDTIHPGVFDTGLDEVVTAESITLKYESGSWMGQIVITSDGMFASVTDWGNFSYAWRNWGEGSFKSFLLRIDKYYFASKMNSGMSYGARMSKGVCEKYAEKILPALQEYLRNNP